MAKEFFKEKGVSFTEYDVLSDVEKRQEMFDRSGQLGVPVIIIDSDIIVGFDRQRIESLIS